MQSALVFDDIAPIEIPVRIGDKSYILREATGEDARQWRNLNMKAAKFTSDGKVASMEGMADGQYFLVHRCIFSTNGDGKRSDNPIPLVMIKSWPERIIKSLFQKAKEISDLEEKPETRERILDEIDNLQARLREMDSKEEKTKNSSGAMTAGSV